jgi:anti-anti-sigma factor
MDIYMLLTDSILDDGIKLIVLKGRMDIAGTQEIDFKLTVTIAAESSNIIIDLSDVEFMASIGIGVLVRAANALLRRKGKMVFMNPQPNVYATLESTQITQVVPVVNDLESARLYLMN